MFHVKQSRAQMIELALRMQLAPQWCRHFAEFPEDLSTVVFRDTGTTALVAIRAEFKRIQANNAANR